MSKEFLCINPTHVAVDLDRTLFTFYGEDSELEKIQSAEVIPQTAELLALLSSWNYSFSIYTAAFFFRPRFIAEYFPDIYSMFSSVFTRESLINDDAPPDSNVFRKQEKLLEEKPPKWSLIEVPTYLSEKDYKTVQWVAKHRGKAPALISAGVMLDDGRKVKQIGGEDCRVILVRANQIPTNDRLMKLFAQKTFR